uniref:Uncharacterized protein n=1 Tax=Candidatus Kentrum sp. UNK TaxID=2126344 RepID=A0A450ZYL4_9GAMM|nr:MAG: hypothetical protein BECKUNK1418G_GA0071005_100538 [Candidatus Kentron sp. UNK]VFK68617.1 MAG: hypothetical protein BECKUNK1418H_GA0071006_100438 [Candidatus Kentron sp. UNK]
MATTQQKSIQIANGDKVPPVFNHTTEENGRVRASVFEFTQDGAGDAGSTVALIRLPAGRVRILSHLSVIRCSAFGAGATLDVGYAAHENFKGDAVPADPDAIADGIDVSAAAQLSLGGIGAGVAGPSVLAPSRDRVIILATCQGAAIPDGATLTGVICYVND